MQEPPSKKRRACRDGERGAATNAEMVHRAPPRQVYRRTAEGVSIWIPCPQLRRRPPNSSGCYIYDELKNVRTHLARRAAFALLVFAIACNGILGNDVRE